jgi:hypothetical protein
MVCDSGLREALLGARMHTKNNRNFFSNWVNSTEQFGELFCGIDI